MKVRNATWDDLEAVDRLVAACDLADIGECDASFGELREDWRSRPERARRAEQSSTSGST